MDAQARCPEGGMEDRISFSEGIHWPVQPSPHRVCVCHDEEKRVGLGGINYLCASPAVGGTKVAPAEGLIIRKRAF